MREMHRLIRHSDRTEAELNTVNTKLQELSAELQYKARHDPLTGALNRGAVFEQAQTHLSAAPMSLIMLDIDHFKRINDTFGHPTGDAVIQELIERLRTAVGKHGDIGRVGGEEFTILLPNMSLDQSSQLAEYIRHLLANQPFDCIATEYTVTASFGISWSPFKTDFEHAYARADAALYRAKQQGRNQVVSAANPDQLTAPHA
ncbi:GGDEF domain-containing protein [Pusillimonas sp. DMV24BSW_D]|nr:GGDEF domain-containing protein [Pusillimonas sp. DMV24BSW_D]